MVSGSYYLAIQKYPNALEHLKRAHQLNPDLPDLKPTLAAAYAYNADQDLATKLFAEELKRNPMDYTANLLLGWLLLEADRTEDAAKCLNRAREMRPDDPDLLFQLARLARAEERYQDAAGVLEKVIAAKPNFRPAHVLLAQTYRKLKRVSDSAREQEIVNRLNQEEMTRPPAPRVR
jgi:tetratricopeptide (TPR) repeat protein